MENLSVSVDERLLKVARQRAARERTTVELQVCQWLEGYAKGPDCFRQPGQRRQEVEQIMAEIDAMSKTVSFGGRKFTREEMNER